jgi:hypothetical protein
MSEHRGNPVLHLSDIGLSFVGGGNHQPAAHDVSLCTPCDRPESKSQLKCIIITFLQYFFWDSPRCVLYIRNEKGYITTYFYYNQLSIKCV